MDEFNRLLLENGIIFPSFSDDDSEKENEVSLLKEDEEVVDPNVQDQQDPNAAEPIETPEFRNEEVCARYNVIEEYKKIHSLCARIQDSNFYDLRFDVTELKEKIEFILSNIDSFTTNDLYNFKDQILDAIKKSLVFYTPNLNGNDKNIKNSTESNEKELKNDSESKYTTNEEKDEKSTLKEDLELLLSYNNKMKLSIDLNEAKMQLIQSLYRSVHSLESDDFVSIYGVKYKGQYISYIIRDAIEILNKFNKTKVIELNKDGVYTFVAQDNFYRKDNVTIVLHSPVDFDSNTNKIIISSLPDANSIYEFACHIRYAACLYLLHNKKAHSIKYNDSIGDAIIYMADVICNKTFKTDNLKDKLDRCIDDKVIDKSKLFDISYLSKLNITSEAEFKNKDTLEKWLAAYTFLFKTSSSVFPEWVKLFLFAYYTGMKKYIEINVNEIENVHFIKGNSLTPDTLLANLHAFSNIQFLISNLERQ